MKNGIDVDDAEHVRIGLQLRRDLGNDRGFLVVGTVDADLRCVDHDRQLRCALSQRALATRQQLE